MRCTLGKHEAPGGFGYHLNIVGASIAQHAVLDKMELLSVVDVIINAPAELVEREQASTNIDYAAALRVRYEYLEEYPEHRIDYFRRFCEQRLHSAKAPNDA